jgi:Erv1 / Alr family
MNINHLEKWNWPPDIGKNIWGPIGWKWAHSLAQNYPENPSLDESYFTYLRLWYFIINLPCVECRRHAANYIFNNPPELINRNTFKIWMWRFHNNVNKRLGKPKFRFENL